MSLLREIVIADDVKMMMSLCQRLKIAHKLVSEWDGDRSTFGSYVVKFFVAEACDKSGWIEILKFEGLIQWISVKQLTLNRQ